MYVKFMHHAESCCVFIAKNDEEFDAALEQDCSEVDTATFWKLKKEYEDDAVNA